MLPWSVCIFPLYMLSTSAFHIWIVIGSSRSSIGIGGGRRQKCSYQILWYSHVRGLPKRIANFWCRRYGFCALCCVYPEQSNSQSASQPACLWLCLCIAKSNTQLRMFYGMCVCMDRQYCRCRRLTIFPFHSLSFNLQLERLYNRKMFEI